MTKRGRPRKEDGTPEQMKLREIWRSRSSKYYKKNRVKVLEKARYMTEQDILAEMRGEK